MPPIINTADKQPSSKKEMIFSPNRAKTADIAFRIPNTILP